MEVKKKTNNKIIKLFNKKVKCPSCKKKSTEPYAPFCSVKCADLDLIKWFSSENYFNTE
jgi:endogenous inhibitor of DNA gyrase (YacG/DUF329 family)